MPQASDDPSPEDLQAELREREERDRVREAEIASLRSEVQLRLAYTDYLERSLAESKEASQRRIDELQGLLEERIQTIQWLESLLEQHSGRIDGLRDEIRHLERFVVDLPNTYGFTPGRLITATTGRFRRLVKRGA